MELSRRATLAGIGLALVHPQIGVAAVRPTLQLTLGMKKKDLLRQGRLAFRKSGGSPSLEGYVLNQAYDLVYLEDGRPLFLPDVGGPNLATMMDFAVGRGLATIIVHPHSRLLNLTDALDRTQALERWFSDAGYTCTRGFAATNYRFNQTLPKPSDFGELGSLLADPGVLVAEMNVIQFEKGQHSGSVTFASGLRMGVLASGGDGRYEDPGAAEWSLTLTIMDSSWFEGEQSG